MNPKYPIYIVSKGRWKTRLTSKVLERMKVPYWIVVEQSQYDQYAAVIDPSKVLVLPQHYLDSYNTFDVWDATKSKGSGAARNFCWDHSISLGAERHWVLDDNIEAFNRLNRNTKLECDSGSIFRAAEDFVDRYQNIAISGFNYYSFCKSTDKVPPFVLNTKVYSCILIKNDILFRWRGRFNEDVDLCLRVLKAGWVTCQFNAFLAGKVTTQRMTGGNTNELYEVEGTKKKSQMLADMHPDVASVVWKFNRWHHKVDYSPFKGNRLIRKSDAVIPDGANEYGMVLRAVGKRGKFTASKTS
jgi:hypothetical protein